MLDYQVRESVAVITLDNGRLNILTRALHERLYRTLLRFLRDDAVKVAVLTCKEGTSFSAGDDLKEIDLPWGDEPDWSELTMMLLRDKPIIGATRGHCLGQGLIHLLLLTDVRFAVPEATFGFPEIRKGMGGAGIAARLAELIPPTVAWRLALTGDFLDAGQAAQSHLINEIVPENDLLERAMVEARKMAAIPLAALKAEMSPAARFANRPSPWHLLAEINRLWHSQAQ